MIVNLAPTDKVDTRTRILVEAERLFRHYGYGKTTVADIAREMGMSPGNIYRFFASKSALVEALTEMMLEEREAQSVAIFRQSGAVDARVRALLLSEAKHTSEALTADSKLQEMVVVAVTEQWHVVRAYLDRVKGRLTELVEEGIATGVFPAQDAGLAARCAQQAMASWCHPLLASTCQTDPNAASPEQLADFIIAALKSPSRA